MTTLKRPPAKSEKHALERGLFATGKRLGACYNKTISVVFTEIFHCSDVLILVSVALDRRGNSGVGGQGQLWLRRRIARSMANVRLHLNHSRLSPSIVVAMQETECRSLPGGAVAQDL